MHADVIIRERNLTTLAATTPYRLPGLTPFCVQARNRAGSKQWRWNMPVKTIAVTALAVFLAPYGAFAQTWTHDNGSSHSAALTLGKRPVQQSPHRWWRWWRR